MGYVRPTLAQLISQAQSDLQAKMAGTDPLLEKTFEIAICRAVAGLAHGLHGHANYNAKQLTPNSADPQFLTQWASIYLPQPVPKPAVKADISFTILGTPTTIVPAGTLWATNTGTQYSQDAQVTISGGGSVAASATAVALPIVGGPTDNGTAGNQAIGALLLIVTPIVGVNSGSSVTGTLTTGFYQETPAALLSRLLLRLQTPPKGGGPGDYVLWALQQAGATRAWQIPATGGLVGPNGAGTVAVYFVEDANVLPVSIIPVAGDVTSMQTLLNSLAPVTAGVTAYAPTGVTFRPAIQLGVAGGIDSVALETAVYNGIVAMLQRVSTPVGCTVYLQELYSAIEVATGANTFLVTSPASDSVYLAPNMPIVVDTLANALKGGGNAWFT